MSKEHEIFKLGGYLQPTTVSKYGDIAPVQGNIPPGSFFTFTRTIPENRTTGYPAVRIGLGWFVEAKGMQRASFIPNTTALKMDFLNSVYSQMVDVYTELSRTYPNNWAEKAIMSVGYAMGENNMKTARLFASLPADALEELRQISDLHETAFLLHVTPAEQIKQLPLLVKMLRNLKANTPDIMFTHLMDALQLGLDVEELEVALQLPDHMFRELYLE